MDASNKFESQSDLNEKSNDVPEGFSVIQEGEARILQHGNDVFYNKAQVINRDISLSVLRAFIEARRIEHEEKWKKKQKNMLSGSSQSIKAKKNDKDGKDEDEEEEAGDDKLKQKNKLDENKSGMKSHFDSVIGNGEHVISNGGLEQDEIEGKGGKGDREQAEEKEEREEKDENMSYANSNLNQKEQILPPPLPPPRVLEALAASGLRAIRYAKEVEGIGKVVAMDKEQVAVDACKRNVSFNGLSHDDVDAVQMDARVFMLTHEKEFDVVDLDPYGSPSIFLDSAVQCVSDGGILMCTATDMAVLCGNNGEVCYSKYGSYSLKGKYCHEMALRILLSSIQSHASRYKRYIVPVLSLSIDFYIRVFVRIYTSAKEVKSIPSKLSMVYQCTGCDSFHLQPIGRIAQKNQNTRYLPATAPKVSQTCDDCGKSYNLGGPVWSEPIHDRHWVTSLLTGIDLLRTKYPAYEKIHSILTAVSEELVDVPLYLSVHSLSATLKCTPPSATLFRSALANAGYFVSGAHASPLGTKTNAPMQAVWDVMRCWVKSHPVKEQAEGMPASSILAKETKIKVDFSRNVSALSAALTKGVARFLPNPEHCWGPKPRAGRKLASKHNQSVSKDFEKNENTELETGSDQEARETKRTKIGPS